MIKQLPPARAKHVSDKRLGTIWDDPSWVAEEKMNGWRFLMHVGGELDRTHLTGRRISSVTDEYSEKGMCVPCLWPTTLMGYTVLDGEILPPEGVSFHDIAGIMNVDPESAAEEIRRIGEPRYRAFDVLFADGRDYREHSYLERRDILKVIVDELAHPLITMVPSGPATQSTFDSIVEAGGEGVILKNIFAAYGDSGAWVKVKREATLDVVVTGFTDAKFGKTGKYHGQIGAVVVAVYLRDGTLVEVGQVSGMDDATRLQMTANPGQWVGTVIEITAQEFGRERLLHPRYGRPRPDASPREATYEKMMRDLGAAQKPVDDDGQLRLF